MLFNQCLLEGKLSSICETDEVFINASDNLDFPPHPSFALRNPPSPQVNTDLIYTKDHKCGIIVLGDKL